MGECGSMQADFAASMLKGAEPMVAADGFKVVCHPPQANWGWPGPSRTQLARLGTRSVQRTL